MQDSIEIRRAREHNLKNVSLSIPHKTMTVFTGVSGSGKSSLAFDTIFKEGQRRYLESLSSYARQFLGVMSKADVDHIEGLSPTVSIDQKSVNKNPRSTVGTVTEIYDFLRLFFARIGTPYCSACGTKISKQSEEQIARTIFADHMGEQTLVLAPIVRERKGEYRKELEALKAEGFFRVRVDGVTLNLEDTMPELKRYEKHTIEVVIDRLRIEEKAFSRLTEDIEKATALTKGRVALYRVKREGTRQEPSPPSAKKKTKMETIAQEREQYRLFTTERSCAQCGHSTPEIEPNLFSFNNPAGACPTCGGLGVIHTFIEDLIVANDAQTVYDGALACFIDGHMKFDFSYGIPELEAIAKTHEFDLKKPWKSFTKKEREYLLHGTKKEVDWRDRMRRKTVRAKIPGIATRLNYLYTVWRMSFFEMFMEESICGDCGGTRLNREARSVKFARKSIAEFSAMTIAELKKYFDAVTLPAARAVIGTPIVKEILYRLTFLEKVGLTYLTLERGSPTLSGGESQRIRLAAQIGSGLEGVLYVLDEPSIGLHQSDNRKLIESLHALRDKNNTVIVVEHDKDTMENADYLVDIGPYAGAHGGEIVGHGVYKDLLKSNDSITARYLRGDEAIETPKTRRKGNGKHIRILGASHFNLKNIDVTIPLGAFVAVTGVSGSGKSTLINAVLKRALFRHFYHSKEKPGAYESIEGLEHIDKVVEIDQSPIGRTPRSNPATYTKVMTPIRDLFANTQLARMRGYSKSRFSFNVEGGRCETCGGAGVVELEMQFLSNALVPCEECNGKRFNRETLDVTFKEKNIYDVLDLSVDEARDFFSALPSITRILDTMSAIGLGYVKLGQPSTTLSGGEAQRIKLASELRKIATGQTLYILDEPTTGLHFDDIKKLLRALQGLVDKGNTVLLIEHNIDMIKTADYIIDLGPAGGAGGGRIVAKGTPEAVAKSSASLTGKELKSALYPEETPSYVPVQTKKKAKKETLVVTGAKKHNLKNISVTIPKNKLTVVTGTSGSGKTSLAFDTIFKEGQRKFVESLSTYARRFLGRFEDANVERLEGLAPAIAIDQKNVSRNPRSTVATVTETYDYLRLIFARVAKPVSPYTRAILRAHSSSLLAKEIAEERDGEKLYIVAPLYDRGIEHRFGGIEDVGFAELKKIVCRILEANYARVMINGVDYPLEDLTEETLRALSDSGIAFLGIVIDRVIVDGEKQPRVADALEQAFSYSEGSAFLKFGNEPGAYYTRFPADLPHGLVFDEEITPRHFSFNSHWGACPACKGIGAMMTFDMDKAIVNDALPLFDGALQERIHSYFAREDAYFARPIARALKKAGVTKTALYSTPYGKLDDRVKRLFFYGDGVTLGVAQTIETLYEENDLLSENYSEWRDAIVSPFLSEKRCPSCEGQRLNERIRCYRIAGKNISDMTAMTIEALIGFFADIEKKISARDMTIAKEAIKEITARLSFLQEVGLSYLTLNRKFSTLSGGEAQRIRLASQLGSKLTGVLYVLDEPTVGLHPRDTGKLLQTLNDLRDLGNTLVVVEHDRDTIARADFIIDMGPGAGAGGGEIVFKGTFDALVTSNRSLTARYITGAETVGEKTEVRAGNGNALTLKNVVKNNLKRIDVTFPLNTLTVVTGVSGSGKSSLVVDALYPAVYNALNRMHAAPDGYEALLGMTDALGARAVTNVILVDQISVQGSIRSTLASFTKMLDKIRALFALTPEAKKKGFKANRFAYNNREGRCKICEGKGAIKVSMHFLSDLEIECPECKGARYNEETLSVHFKGLTIADVFNLTVDDALRFFDFHTGIRRSALLLRDVGLGYVKLGQRLDTFSGGELQRLKLSRELARKTDGEHTLYILDEPTTGLHFDDIKKLIAVLNRLVDSGNTCVLIEHHPDVMRNADYLIDLGPEGGNEGGRIVAMGTPKAVKAQKKGYTYQYL